MPGKTEGQSLITVSMPNHPDAALKALGTFEVRTGGNATSENSTYTPGGTNTPQSIGGRQTFEDCTVNRVWDTSRDRPVIQKLRKVRGDAFAGRISVSDQPLGPDYLPVGDAETYHGVLAEVAGGDSDSESGDPRRMVLVVTVDKIT